MDENTQLTDSLVLDVLDSALGREAYSKASSAKCDIITDVDPETLVPVIEIDTKDSDISVEIETQAELDGNGDLEYYWFSCTIITSPIEDTALEDLSQKWDKWKKITETAMAIGDIEFNPYDYVE